MIFLGLRKIFPAVFLVIVTLAYCSIGVADAPDREDIRSSCWAARGLSEAIAAVAGSPERWSCGGGRPSIEASRVMLRFEIAAAHPIPRYFLSRRSALKALHVLAIDRDNTIRRISVPGSALASSIAGGYFKAPLPEVTRATRWVVVAIDMPSHRMTLERAYLAPTDAVGGTGGMRFLLLLASLGGMLLMPLLFNAAFYRVLRQPFVLWHSALAFSLLMTILVSSGLSVVLFDPSAMTLNWLTAVIFGMTIASGIMFTHSFIEPGGMHPGLRRLLPYCAAWAMLLSLCHAAFPFVARAVQSSIYTAAFAPVLAVFMIAMIDSLRRGSRAARFQAIGYLPMILVASIRLVTGIIPWAHSADAMILFYLGCVSEVLFTTLGMADRFVTIRRERDRARDEANLLERLSETDPLTGLLNRRAFERQFERLRAKGFATLAVLDLDNFKAINDVNGHAAGDAVLKAVAEALQAGPDLYAYRFGGEEFVLFLRGKEAAIEAERRREAISAVVSKAFPALGRPVTASMGVTGLSRSEGFAAAYERADKLLYAAKSAEKNRSRSANMPASSQASISRLREGPIEAAARPALPCAGGEGRYPRSVSADRCR